MPLLSRFRKTVSSVKPKLTSSSNGKGANATDISYQRSTKSSTEKSLKPKNTFLAYMSSENRNDRNDSRHSRSSGSRGVSDRDLGTRERPLLRRSSTFTLEDDETENIPEPRKIDNDRRGDVSHGEYQHRNSDFNSYGRNRGKPVLFKKHLYIFYFILQSYYN